MKRKYDENELLNLEGRATTCKYGVDLMLKYPAKFDFSAISWEAAAALSLDDIKKLIKYINWNNFFRSYRGTAFFAKNLDFIIENYKEIGLLNNNILTSPLTKDQFEKFLNNKEIREYLKNRNIIRLENLSLEMVEEYKDFLDWGAIPNLYKTIKKQEHLITIEFARKYADRINWRAFTSFYASNSVIKEEILIEFSEKWDIEELLRNGSLTEDTLNIVINLKNFDEIGWEYISRYQEFSEEFFIQNLFKLNLEDLAYNTKMKNKDFLGVKMNNPTVALLLEMNNIKVKPVFEKQ